MAAFSLHPDFETTSHTVGNMRLASVRLHDDARFPWLILIPRRDGARELDHLSVRDRAELMEELIAAGAAVRGIGAALGRPVEKLNVAQLGNITPQLHVHVIGRRADDAAWPKPVFGAGEAEPYDPALLSATLAVARRAIGG